MAKWMIQDEQICETPFQILTDEESPQGTETEAISITRFLEWVERESEGKTGVIVEPAENPDVLLPHFGRIAFIAISFPTFTDGRGYSHARRIRKNHEFKGTIVSFGDVLRDQLMHMKRCGISAFILREDQDPEGCLEVFSRFPQFYQKSL